MQMMKRLGRLGGVAGGPEATGSVEGVVFLDDNRNGRRDAAEQVAPNITVVLDGRYSVRTDINGQYRFDRVTVGARRLQVQEDNLPLPWSLDPSTAEQSVVVRVRQASRLDFAAQRPQ